MAGSAHEIKCGRSGSVYAVDLDGDDAFGNGDRICFAEEDGSLGPCYTEPFGLDSVRACLKHLDIDLAVPLSNGKSLQVLSELSEVLDVIRYGGLTAARVGEVGSEAAELAHEVDVDFDEKTAARIAREGSINVMEAAFIVSERSSASKVCSEIFEFEKYLLDAAKYAAEAGVAFDKEKAKGIMMRGYANALKVSRQQAEEIASFKPVGFNLSVYAVSSGQLEGAIGSAKKAAKGLGKPHDERWESGVRRNAQQSLYEAVAEMLIDAVQRINEAYNDNDFFEEKGHRGLDFLKKAVTIAREAARAGGFEFEEEFFEGIARDFSVAVYNVEKGLVEAFSTRPGIRFDFEVDFFPRVRLWAYIAGIPYDEDWEQGIRERASDTY